MLGGVLSALALLATRLGEWDVRVQQRDIQPETL